MPLRAVVRCLVNNRLLASSLRERHVRSSHCRSRERRRENRRRRRGVQGFSPWYGELGVSMFREPTACKTCTLNGPRQRDGVRRGCPPRMVKRIEISGCSSFLRCITTFSDAWLPRHERKAVRVPHGKIAEGGRGGLPLVTTCQR